MPYKTENSQILKRRAVNCFFLSEPRKLNEKLIVTVLISLLNSLETLGESLCELFFAVTNARLVLVKPQFDIRKQPL